MSKNKKKNKAKRCEHGKEKYYCKECDGKGLCEHEKRKHFCKNCNGKQICKHGKQRHFCLECNGKQKCEHEKQRHFCPKCNGKQICEHEKQRHFCLECKGKQICKHEKQISICRICGPIQYPDYWCKNCKYVNITNSNYKPYCFECYCVLHPDEIPPRQYKLKEHYLRESLKKEYKNIKFIFDKKIDGGCSLRRPDILIDFYTHIIIIECDENRHFDYSCENKRMMQIFQDLGNRPVIFLRFNPDGYKDKETGKNVTGCFLKTKTINNSLQIKEWNRRFLKLKEKIDYNISNIPNKEVNIEYLFYE